MVGPADFVYAIHRVRACYADDPGLSVPIRGLARLSGVRIDVCTAAVTVLNKEGFLHRRRDDAWVLAADVDVARYR